MPSTDDQPCACAGARRFGTHARGTREPLEADTALRIASDRYVDHEILRRSAHRQRPVFTLDRAFLKLTDQIRLRGERARHHHETGGISIQPMHDARTRHVF